MKKMTNETEQTMSTRRTTLYEVQETGDDASLTSVDFGNWHEDSTSSDPSIARKENRWVSYGKMLVLFVIVSVAAAMGFVTYTFVKEKEDTEYRNHFREASSSLVDVSQGRARDIYENLEAFSAMLTTLATSANATWPFVFIPDFQVHALVSSQITGASTMTLTPIVTHQDRQQWELFTQNVNKQWMSEGHEYDREVNEALYVDNRYNRSRSGEPKLDALRWDVIEASPVIWNVRENGTLGAAEAADVYYPAWQTAPAPDFTPYVNLDLKDLGYFSRVIEGMLETDRPVLTEISDASFLDDAYDRRFDPTEQEEPHSYLMHPVYDSLKKDRKAVAVLMAFFRWGNFFEKVLPSHETGIVIVVYGSCNQTFSYEIVDDKPTFLGNADFHDPRYDDVGEDFQIAPFNLAQTDERKYCQYNARIFPSDPFKDKHFTNDPTYFAMAVIACFAVTTMVFVAYDFLVTKRQKTVMDQATKTTKIVNAMYPANVRQRLMDEASCDSHTFRNSGKTELMSDDSSIFGSKPIADLFPEATILFADLVGFTAWSSVREPTQVFQLLETIYHKFDTIARRMRVFKVETIGDCYVAVCGLPMKRMDHAVVMARFASQCLNGMHSVLHTLEYTLGPDTTSLAIRVGLHSGPVTAGVLRGEKGRFQLFGDTVNTASRMESTGEPGKIQVSAETASILTAVGKERWLTEREDQVHAKGKGIISTYWLNVTAGSVSSSSNVRSSQGSDIEDAPPFPRSERPRSTRAVTVTKEVDASTKSERLVQWNVELLTRHLKEILAQRASKTKKHVLGGGSGRPRTAIATAIQGDQYGDNILGEVKDVLELAKSDLTLRKSAQQISPQSIQLSVELKQQLTDYVQKIAALYHDNPFHNWEHASHVTMSVTKLMGRIVHPTEILASEEDHTMFAATFQDPLIQFSCVLSGLVHDADHSGLSNATLVEEQNPLSIKYNAKSVAEQNSLDLCWKLLMRPAYAALQEAIFDNQQDELERFRSILVQCVLATDIADKDLGAKRKERWAKAFAHDSGASRLEDHSSSSSSSLLSPTNSTGTPKRTSSKSSSGQRNNVKRTSSKSSSSSGHHNNVTTTATTKNIINMKATIVLEHLMQASDVAHTMQHWHVFRKWNQRLFEEVYGSYLDGHLPKDPSVSWYQGEIGFFDYYIIPLANKLETCGVFGVSSTEYKSYAEENRREWAEKGKAIVEEYIAATLEKRKEAAITKEEAAEVFVEEYQEEEVWTPAGLATASLWV